MTDFFSTGTTRGTRDKYQVCRRAQRQSQPEGPQARSWGPEGPQTSSCLIFLSSFSLAGNISWRLLAVGKTERSQLSSNCDFINSCTLAFQVLQPLFLRRQFIMVEQLALHIHNNPNWSNLQDTAIAHPMLSNFVNFEFSSKSQSFSQEFSDILGSLPFQNRENEPSSICCEVTAKSYLFYRIPSLFPHTEKFPKQ